MVTISLETRLRSDGTLELRVPTHFSPGRGTPGEKEFILEHYRRLRESFVTQGNRLWARFNYLLVGQAALVGVFLTREKHPVVLPVLGFVSALLWYVVAAQDLWFYQQAREKLLSFTSRLIIPRLSGWSDAEEEEPYKVSPWWRYVFCFKIPKLGTTHFASVFPILFVVFWILSWTGIVPWNAPR